MTVLVGGVAQLYQGDLDLGRIACERLAGESLAHGAVVEDLSYGAVAVAQRLEEARPRALILVGAAERMRPPATVERRRIHPPDLPETELQLAVGDAVTGYVTIDLMIEVAHALGVLPARTIAIEVEPARTKPAARLSSEVERALEAALSLVRAEVERIPLLELADDLRSLRGGDPAVPAAAAESLGELLAELELLEEEGRWGQTFELRDRLRRVISESSSGDALAAVEWALGWALIEELDRLERTLATAQSAS